MKKTLSLISICSLFVLFSCTLPSGVEVTEYFPVNSTYCSLYISDGMHVIVSDEVDEIVITADENVMEKITIENTSSTLRIYRSDVSIAYLNTTKVWIPYNQYLKDVEVHMDSEFSTEYGIGRIDYASTVKVGERSEFSSYVIAKDLDLIVTDNSEVYCSYDIEDELYLKIDGNSDVELEGSSDRIQLKMSNNASILPVWSGNYYAPTCRYCYGEMKNNCKAYLDCEEELEVNLYNNSVLYFTSDPDYDGSWWDDSSALYYSGK